MTFGTLDFHTALITGGGGGIGKAIAKYFVSQGKQVIIAGRTEKNLQETVQELGHNASYYTLDTGNLESLPDFITKVTSKHPNLDCLVNNAGVQKPLDVSELSPREFLQKADQEIAININGPMHLAVGFLPHLRRRKEGAVIINVSSTLGYLPTSVINPVYNGSKAWVHFFSMNLRTQLQGTNVRVIELAPPQVSTDLHRERKDPDDNKGPSAMSVDEFMDDIVAAWKEDRDTIGAGPSKKIIQRWYREFGEDYDTAASSWGRK